MKYYLNTYLSGMNQYQAYEYLGMDPVIYVAPNYIYNEKDLINWQSERKDYVADAEMVLHNFSRIIIYKHGSVIRN